MFIGRKRCVWWCPQKNFSSNFKKLPVARQCRVEKTMTNDRVNSPPIGQRDRGPLLCEGDGLPGGSQLTGDLRGRARHVRQEGAPEGGQTKFYLS